MLNTCGHRDRYWMHEERFLSLADLSPLTTGWLTRTTWNDAHHLAWWPEAVQEESELGFEVNQPVAPIEVHETKRYLLQKKGNSVGCNICHRVRSRKRLVRDSGQKTRPISLTAATTMRWRRLHHQKANQWISTDLSTDLLSGSFSTQMPPKWSSCTNICLFNGAPIKRLIKFEGVKCRTSTSSSCCLFLNNA